MCEWFARCMNRATKLVMHPAFPNGVPTCERCAYFAEHGEFPR